MSAPESQASASADTPNVAAVHTPETRHWLDRFGVLASLVCAIHCAAVPILLSAFPTATLGFFGDERFEWAILGAIIAIGIGSLLPSYWRRHRDLRPLALFATGMGLLVLARTIAQEHPTLETIGSVIAALMVATAHIVNIRANRACERVCVHAHPHVHTED
jgi:hypothetical protein